MRRQPGRDAADLELLAERGFRFEPIADMKSMPHRWDAEPTPALAILTLSLLAAT